MIYHPLIIHDDHLFDSLHGESKSRDGGVSSNRGSASVSSSNTKDNTSTVLLGNLAIMMMAMMSVTRITSTMMMMTNLNGGDLPTHWNHFYFFTVQCRHLVFGFWLHFCLHVKFSFSYYDDNHNYNHDDKDEDKDNDNNDDDNDDEDEDNDGKDEDDDG